LTVMEDPKLRFTALRAGQLDVIASTVDTALLYLKKADDFKYVAAIDDSNGGDGIVATKDIKSIKDLKGKKVAVNEGSVSQFYLNVLLAKAGLKESDLQTVNMTAADAGSAFMAKDVGGWLKDPKVFAETLRGIKFYGAEDNKKFFGTKANPGPLSQTVKDAIDVWSGHGKIQVKTTPSDLIDYEFVNE